MADLNMAVTFIGLFSRLINVDSFLCIELICGKIILRQIKLYTFFIFRLQSRLQSPETRKENRVLIPLTLEDIL